MSYFGGAVIFLPRCWSYTTFVSAVLLCGLHHHFWLGTKRMWCSITISTITNHTKKINTKYFDEQEHFHQPTHLQQRIVRTHDIVCRNVPENPGTKNWPPWAILGVPRYTDRKKPLWLGHFQLYPGTGFPGWWLISKQPRGWDSRASPVVSSFPRLFVSTTTLSSFWRLFDDIIFDQIISPSKSSFVFDDIFNLVGTCTMASLRCP